MKVCMLALHDCHKYYITVRKLTRALAEAGNNVEVIATLSRETVPYEESDGARIFRVSGESVFSWSLQAPGRLFQKLSHSINHILNKLFPLSFQKYLKSTINQGIHNPFDHFIRNLNFARGAFRENPFWFIVSGCFFLLYIPLVLARLLYRLILKLCPFSYIRYLTYYFRSFRLARQLRPDVYHAHDLVTLPAAYLAARINGGKVVYHSNELWLDLAGKQRSKINRYLVTRIESFLIRRTDANIMVGESGSKYLAEKYHIDPPIVILNVPYYRLYQPSELFYEKLDISRDRKIVLYMGVISEHKGIEEAIKSIKYLSNCDLVIFGFGYQPYISSLKKLIEIEGFRDRVHFFDAVPFDEVTRYAMSAHISLVLHQNLGLNYYYVTPNKLFESIGAGLPVVGSNFPEIKRFIDSFHFGLTCDPTNPKEIANAINYLLSDNDRYETMRRNALEAAKTLNWENESRKLISLYEELKNKR